MKRRDDNNKFLESRKCSWPSLHGAKVIWGADEEEAFSMINWQYGFGRNWHMKMTRSSSFGTYHCVLRAASCHVVHRPFIWTYSEDTFQPQYVWISLQYSRKLAHILNHKRNQEYTKIRISDLGTDFPWELNYTSCNHFLKYCLSHRIIGK